MTLTTKIANLVRTIKSNIKLTMHSIRQYITSAQEWATWVLKSSMVEWAHGWERRVLKRAHNDQFVFGDLLRHHKVGIFDLSFNSQVVHDNLVTVIPQRERANATSNPLSRTKLWIQLNGKYFELYHHNRLHMCIWPDSIPESCSAQ